MTTEKTNEEMIAEFNAKFMANNRMSGYGLETTCHQPCPFCAEPDFMSYKILDMESIVTEEHVCKACERGLITEMERSEQGVLMRMFQTRGPDVPDWYTPKIPRKEIDVGQTPQ